MMRSCFFELSPIWADGVYLTKVGSLFPPMFTFFGFCDATAPLTSASNAFFVRSAVSATSSWLGLERSRSPASARCRSGMRSLKDV